MTTGRESKVCRYVSGAGEATRIADGKHELKGCYRADPTNLAKTGGLWIHFGRCFSMALSKE